MDLHGDDNCDTTLYWDTDCKGLRDSSFAFRCGMETCDFAPGVCEAMQPCDAVWCFALGTDAYEVARPCPNDPDCVEANGEPPTACWRDLVCDSRCPVDEFGDSIDPDCEGAPGPYCPGGSEAHRCDWGKLDGSCYPGGTCDAGLVCEDGTCVPFDTTGELGGQCFGNGTCNGELVCVNGVCQERGDEGTLGGPCRAHAPVCDEGLVCRNGLCAEPPPDEFAWQQPCTPAGAKTDGETCNSHCECASGYCYDEGYLNGFRFCTRRCDGFEFECLSDGQTQTYACLNFSGAWVDLLIPPIYLRNFCVPGCVSDADCTEIDPAWSGCAFPDTQWNGHTVSPRKTCIAQ